MNNQDREEALGRLLTSMQQHSHSETLAPGSAKREGGAACLDAESLAAWAEDSLTAGQRSAAESHVASCARCQSMLAAMARTATVADTPAAGGERPRSWVFRFAPWIAALGGAAAVALIMIGAQPGTTEQAAPEAVAISQDAAQHQRLEPKESAAPVDAPAARSAQPRARQDQEVPKTLAKSTENRATGLADAAAKKEKPAPQAFARDEKDRPAAPPAAPAQAATAAPPLVTPVGERAQEGQRGASARRAAALDALAESVVLAPAIIQSPEANVRWRIVGGTAVQHSADAGATWTTQDVKAEAPLVAGSAPSASVCWIVGRQGIVIVTTDGRTWQRVTSPAAIDLLAVVATSADSAVVTAPDGRSFTTSDRGRTWH